jgi:hypothetical protein
MWIRLSGPSVCDDGLCQNAVISVLRLAAARPIARLRREIGSLYEDFFGGRSPSRRSLLNIRRSRRGKADFGAIPAVHVTSRFRDRFVARRHDSERLTLHINDEQWLAGLHHGLCREPQISRLAPFG